MACRIRKGSAYIITPFTITLLIKTYSLERGNLPLIILNPLNHSKMLVKKQMKYFDVPLEHAWKVPVLQELLNTRMNDLFVEGFDDYT